MLVLALVEGKGTAAVFFYCLTKPGYIAVSKYPEYTIYEAMFLPVSSDILVLQKFYDGCSYR